MWNKKWLTHSLLIAEQCAESDEDSDCVNANQQCGQIEGIYAQSGYSFYDIRQQGDDTPHPFVDELNKASVIKELGARGHFSMCSDSVVCIEGRYTRYLWISNTS